MRKSGSRDPVPGLTTGVAAQPFAGLNPAFPNGDCFCVLLQPWSAAEQSALSGAARFPPSTDEGLSSVARRSRRLTSRGVSLTAHGRHASEEICRSRWARWIEVVERKIRGTCVAARTGRISFCQKVSLASDRPLSGFIKDQTIRAVAPGAHRRTWPLPHPQRRAPQCRPRTLQAETAAVVSSTRPRVRLPHLETPACSTNHLRTVFSSAIQRDACDMYPTPAPV